MPVIRVCAEMGVDCSVSTTARAMFAGGAYVGDRGEESLPLRFALAACSSGGIQTVASSPCGAGLQRRFRHVLPHVI